MRPSWVVTGVLAVIGAFLFTLQISWLLRFEPEWLPYPVHIVGAMLAGGAMAQAAPTQKLREPLAAGMIAVLVLAAITWLLPRAFTLTAARIDQRWLVTPVITVASGLACATGAWLFGRNAPPRVVGIVAVAAMVGACAILLGGRLGLSLGVPASFVPSTIEIAVLGFLAGVAVQRVVDREAVIAIGVGVAIFVGFGIVALSMKGTPVGGAAAVATLVPIVTAALGARVTPKPRSS